MANETKSGPTGTFPDGKINEADAGGIQIAVGVDKKNGLVLLEFGTPIKWIGLNYVDAIGLAEIILVKAEHLMESDHGKDRGEGPKQTPEVGPARD